MTSPEIYEIVKKLEDNEYFKNNKQISIDRLLLETKIDADELVNLFESNKLLKKYYFIKDKQIRDSRITIKRDDILPEFKRLKTYILLGVDEKIAVDTPKTEFDECIHCHYYINQFQLLKRNKVNTSRSKPITVGYCSANQQIFEKPNVKCTCSDKVLIDNDIFLSKQII